MISANVANFDLALFALRVGDRRNNSVDSHCHDSPLSFGPRVHHVAPVKPLIFELLDERRRVKTRSWSGIDSAI